VNVELRVDVSGVQDGDVPRLAVADGTTLADLPRLLKRTRYNGSGTQADDDSELCDEFPPRAA